MMQNVVIPYNDQCDEQMYKFYLERMDWMTITLKINLSFTKYCDLARSLIIDHLITHNSYQKYYTLNQIDHLAERFAQAYIKGQKQLYIY